MYKQLQNKLERIREKIANYGNFSVDAPSSWLSRRARC